MGVRRRGGGEMRGVQGGGGVRGAERGHRHEGAEIKGVGVGEEHGVSLYREG